MLNVLHKTCHYFRTELGNESLKHCHTHTFSWCIISLTTCLSMTYMLSLFKNILHTTHVYFVMSIVSAFTDPNVQTPHIPSSRSPVYFLLPSLLRYAILSPKHCVSVTLGTLLFAAICYSLTRAWDSAGNEMWLWYFMRLSLPLTRALVPVWAQSFRLSS